MTSKLITGLALIFTSCFLTTYGQTTRKVTIQDPLSTVSLLLSQTAPDEYRDEKICLVWSFFHVGSFREMVAATMFVETGSFHDDDFLAIAKRLLMEGKRPEANEFADLLLRRAGDDRDRKRKLTGLLSDLGRENEALELGNNEDGTLDVETYLEVADGLIRRPDRQRAKKVLESIEPEIEKSEWIRDIARFALHSARLGESEKASRYLNIVLDRIVWRENDIEMEFDQRVALDDVTDALFRLSRFDEAESVINRRGFSKDGKWLFTQAVARYEHRESAKGDELIERILKNSNPAEYGDSFILGDIVDHFVRRGRLDRAVAIAKSLSGNEYTRQSKLMELFERFIREKKSMDAADALDFAYERTSKIDVSQPESGNRWSSGQWEQAQYRARIALRFARIGHRERALRMIRDLEKPYLRAQALAEFAGISAKFLPKPKLAAYLEEALQSVREENEIVFDAKRFEVYPIIAQAFSAMGFKSRSNAVFAEAILRAVEANGTRSSVIPVCRIGVDYRKSRLGVDAKMRSALDSLAKVWEEDQ